MPATTLYGIDVEVAVGVGRPAEWAAWGTGEWGVHTWGDPDTALGDWVDVTCQVEDGLQLQAGVNAGDGIITRWEAATVRVHVARRRLGPVGGAVRRPGRPAATGTGPVAVHLPGGRGRRRSRGPSTTKGGGGSHRSPAGLARTEVLATDYTSDLANWRPRSWRRPGTTKPRPPG